MKIFMALMLFSGVVNAMDISRNTSGEIARSSNTLRVFQQLNPCPSTGDIKGSCPGFVRDHINPLCAGGRDLPSNVKWSEFLYSHLRDKQEGQLCAELKRKYTQVQLDEPLDHLCTIIHDKNLTMLVEICDSGSK